MALNPKHLCGLRCSAICLTKQGDEYETNNCFNYGDCTDWRICRRTVHIMPIGLCRSGGRIYDNREQFVSHRIYIRRHGGQLFGIKPIGFMHNVCADRCQLYGCIRYIRIYRRMRNGINGKVCRQPTIIKIKIAHVGDFFNVAKYYSASAGFSATDSCAGSVSVDTVSAAFSFDSAVAFSSAAFCAPNVKTLPATKASISSCDCAT